MAASPFRHAVAAISCGVHNDQVILDLNYPEDSAASVDMNVVASDDGKFIEIQASGEESTFSDCQLADMLAMARKGIQQLFEAQQRALNEK